MSDWRCPVCGLDETLNLSHEQCLDTLARWIASILCRRAPEAEALTRDVWREEIALCAREIAGLVSQPASDPLAKGPSTR